MGILVDGRWTDAPLEPSGPDGRFVRSGSQYRNWVTPDGSLGPTGDLGFKAEPGRYHLYVSYACPWAHRTLIMRALKGLEDAISVSVVHWLNRDNGWTFEPADGVIPDPIIGARYLYEVYRAGEPLYSGRVTVPVLWDRQTGRIVNNESSEIIRMLGRAFDDVGATPGDYYPADLATEIEVLNERIYTTLNNGVYRAGFATAQAAYEEAVVPLFETLDWLEQRLTDRRYLCGSRLSEADIRLLPTLLRFDAVYYGHFKCNLRRIQDYPALWAYTRDLVQRPDVRPTFRLDHIKKHYYASQVRVNPSAVVPVGPLIDFDAPHDRSDMNRS